MTISISAPSQIYGGKNKFAPTELDVAATPIKLRVK